VAKSSRNKGSASAKKKPVRASGRPAGLFTWLTVGLVVVVIAVLVGIKVFGSSSTSSKNSFVAASPAIVNELTTIPASVFNDVGVTSQTVTVTAPSVFPKEKLLEATTSTGAKVPEVFYAGGEFCPFCAAERWPLIIALSRFGTWKDLGDMASYSGDEYPNTQTFTFAKSTYTSRYVSFTSLEEYRNYLNAAGTAYATFQVPTKAENALIAKYDEEPYFPQTQENIPFITIGNQTLISGSSYSPSALTNLSRAQIASTLSTPTNLVTQAIIATANYITAAICHATGGQPGNVCDSSGVKAATAALKY